MERQDAVARGSADDLEGAGEPEQRPHGDARDAAPWSRHPGHLDRGRKRPDQRDEDQRADARDDRDRGVQRQERGPPLDGDERGVRIRPEAGDPQAHPRVRLRVRPHARACTRTAPGMEREGSVCMHR
jgi:hypothetical protein